MLRAFILLMFCISCQAHGAILLSGQEQVVAVLGEARFARDGSGTVSISEQSNLMWRAYDGPGVPTFGYTDDAIWMQVAVTNTSSEVIDVVAELSVARLREVSWYVLDGDTVEASISGGLAAHEGGMRPESRYPVFFFLVPAGQSRTVYLRVASDSSIYFPVVVSPVRAYVRYSALRDFRDYAFAGASAAILLLALVNGWIMRNRLFGLLAILVTGFLGYYLVFNGYYHWFGGPFAEWVNRQFMLSMALGAHWAFYAFTLTYVRLHGSPGFWRRGGRIFSCGIGCIGVLLLLLPFRLSVSVFTGGISLCYGASAVIGWHLLRRRKYQSDYFVAGTWGVLICVNLLLILNFFGVLPVVIPAVQLLRLLMLFIFVMFFAIVMVQQQTRQWERERMRQIEQLATQAHLHALRYQLNPHFLFNTLTSIEALSRKSPQMIAPLVRRLAAFLRLRIHPSADGMATLEQEWESICAYLDIEKVRFGDNLQLTCQISADARACRVPEMVLQPLVENAIKHGMQTSEVLTLSVCACVRAGQLQIRVENSGKLAAHSGDSEEGIGIANVRQRLACLYGDAARFDLREEPGMVVAEIFMPAEEVDV